MPYQTNSELPQVTLTEPGAGYLSRAFNHAYAAHAGEDRTSVSIPYHIGNGYHGRVPGNGYALIYPIAVPAVCFVLSLFLMPETRQNRIWEGPAGNLATQIDAGPIGQQVLRRIVAASAHLNS
jgi:hypothetical protein